MLLAFRSPSMLLFRSWDQNKNFLMKLTTLLKKLSPLFNFISSDRFSASLPTPSEVLNTAGVEVPFSACSSTSRRYYSFFWSSWLTYSKGILFSKLVVACEIKNLTSINASTNGDQRFLALTPSWAPGDVLEPLGSFSAARGSRGGSTLTPLHTSFSISAMSLWGSCV